VAPTSAYRPSGRADCHTPGLRSLPLGCVGYQCLAGRPPFLGESAASVMYQHQYGIPPRLTQLQPDIPGPVAEAIARVLQKDPQLRYARAGDVAAALGGVSAMGAEIFHAVGPAGDGLALG
jgi:serine/threonine-protein kinase